MKSLLFTILLFTGSFSLSQGQEEPVVPEFKLELKDSSGNTRIIRLSDLTVQDTKDSLVDLRYEFKTKHYPVKGIIVYAPYEGGDAHFIAFQNTAELAQAFQKIFNLGIKINDDIVIDQLVSLENKAKFEPLKHTSLR